VAAETLAPMLECDVNAYGTDRTIENQEILFIGIECSVLFGTIGSVLHKRVPHLGSRYSEEVGS
jgi:hypothetical protein